LKSAISKIHLPEISLIRNPFPRNPLFQNQPYPKSVSPKPVVPKSALSEIRFPKPVVPKSALSEIRFPKPVVPKSAFPEICFPETRCSKISLPRKLFPRNPLFQNQPSPKPAVSVPIQDAVYKHRILYTIIVRERDPVKSKEDISGKSGRLFRGGPVTGYGIKFIPEPLYCLPVWNIFRPASGGGYGSLIFNNTGRESTRFQPWECITGPPLQLKLYFFASARSAHSECCCFYRKSPRR